MSEIRDDQLGDSSASETVEAGKGGSGRPPAESSTPEPSQAETVARLEAELADQKDRNLRLYAEFDNYRRRTAKEGFDLVATANARLIGKLTDVLDNFQRAFDPGNRASPEDFEKGVRLIYGRFREILEEEGLEEIDPAGGAFDPNVHDALLQQPSDTVPENQVVQTISKGYKLKSKILKHAKVIVSQGKQG